MSDPIKNTSLLHLLITNAHRIRGMSFSEIGAAIGDSEKSVSRSTIRRIETESTTLLGKDMAYATQPELESAGTHSRRLVWVGKKPPVWPFQL